MDTAIMLDHMPFVYELNDANLLMIHEGMVYTSLPDECPRKINGGLVGCARRDRSILIIKNLSLTEFYRAEAAFATDRLGESIIVKEMNGRSIINRFSYNVHENTFAHFHNLIPHTQKN